MKNKNQIIGYGVYYAPNRNGKLFAGLKYELQECFKNQNDAILFCSDLNQCGYIDELHFGYVVYPLNWLPNGFSLK